MPTETNALHSSRRHFLRTAAVAGAAVYVVPAVQVVTMSSASAQSASGMTGDGTSLLDPVTSELPAPLDEVAQPVAETVEPVVEPVVEAVPPVTGTPTKNVPKGLVDNVKANAPSIR